MLGVPPLQKKKKKSALKVFITELFFCILKHDNVILHLHSYSTGVDMSFVDV